MSHDRVDAYLDGELPRGALTPGELARATELERVIETAARPLHAAPVPDLAARVMEQLPELSRRERPDRDGVLARAAAWLLGQRTLTLQWRPAYAMAGAFAVVALVLFGGPGPESPAPSAPVQPVASSEAARLYVQFRLDAPEAERVELAGSFTDWAPAHELRESAPGVWTVIVPLDPGVHDYTFIVDGDDWVIDPYAAQIEDDFGGSNSRLFLPSPVQGA